MWPSEPGTSSLYCLELARGHLRTLDLPITDDKQRRLHYYFERRLFRVTISNMALSLSLTTGDAMP